MRKMIPIIYPYIIERDRYFFKEEGSLEIFDIKTDSICPIKNYKNYTPQVLLSIENHYRSSKRYPAFKLYYLNCIYKGDLRELKDMDMMNIYITAIDKNYTNLNEDNFNVSIFKNLNINDKSKLKIDKIVKYPNRILPNRYGFDENMNLIDLKYKRKVKLKLGSNTISYTLLDKDRNRFQISRDKLILYNYILKGNEKNIEEKYIIVVNNNNSNDIKDISYRLSSGLEYLY